MERTVLICSDVHLCHLKFGIESAPRMENLVEKLNAYHEKTPCEAVIFLGDYSLDHWAWNEKGSWLELGINNTENFVREYAARLQMPYAMLPGNHEQYGNGMWQRVTGHSRQFAVEAGGYLFVCCDNFSGDLDPDHHSDGTYTPTDLEFVKAQLAAHPGIPVVLCAHYFDLNKEPDSFFDYLKAEKRITLLVCGHDHLAKITDLGERADHVCMFHDGHYSYSGTGKLTDVMWGFCAAKLDERGIDIRYIEPANRYYSKDEPMEHAYREQHHRFFPNRI